MNTKVHVHLSPLLALVVATISCAQSDSPTSGDTGPTMKVAIEFELLLNGEKVTCTDTFENVGSGSTSMQLADARLFIQNLSLIDADGNKEAVMLDSDSDYQGPSVALLDFENASELCAENGTKTTHTTLTGKVAEGSYEGLSFSVGVPEHLNHGDPTTADPPLDQAALQWNWNDGYRFMRFDLMPGGGTVFDVHIGSTQCDKGTDGVVTCNQPNRAKVILSSFDLQQDRVVLDLGVLLSGSDLDADLPGCIAGGTPDTCAPIFERLGINSSSGNANATKQQVFRAEPR